MPERGRAREEEGGRGGEGEEDAPRIIPSVKAGAGAHTCRGGGKGRA